MEAFEDVGVEAVGEVVGELVVAGTVVSVVLEAQHLQLSFLHLKP